jgi:hypothetical protein
MGHEVEDGDGARTASDQPVRRRFKVRLLETKARKTLYWTRWSRWSAERGKMIKGGVGFVWVRLCDCPVALTGTLDDNAVLWVPGGRLLVDEEITVPFVSLKSSGESSRQRVT